MKTKKKTKSKKTTKSEGYDWITWDIECAQKILSNEGKKDLKLKPCPFCGKVPYPEITIALFKGKYMHSIKCSSEMCSVYPHVEEATKEYVIQQWNTRNGKIPSITKKGK